MIAYTEKGQGLHVAIRTAGHSMSQENGAWISSDDVAVQAIIDGYTVAQAAREKKAAVSAHATMLRNRVISSYSPGELAAWSIKLAEATVFTANGAAAVTPLLSIEASIRGTSIAALVQRVLENGSMFSTMEAAVAGREGYHRDMLDACTSFEEVASYDITVGWPAL